MHIFRLPNYICIHNLYLTKLVKFCVFSFSGKETTVTDANFGDALNALDDGITGDTKVIV